MKKDVWGKVNIFGSIIVGLFLMTLAYPAVLSAQAADYFGYRFTGYIEVPTDGMYTFYTTSDDGSQLFIGDTMVVDNDGLHAARERSGTIGLKAGKHAITVTFFEKTGGEVLEVRYEGPGIAKQLIPDSVLFRAGYDYDGDKDVDGVDLADFGADWGTKVNVTNLPVIAGQLGGQS